MTPDDVTALIDRYNDAWNLQDDDVFPLRDGPIARKNVYSTSHRPRELTD